MELEVEPVAAPALFAAAGLPHAPALARMGQVRDVVFDARAAGPEKLFFAWRGARHDGHDFALTAAERGAAGVVAERPIAGLGVPLYLTPAPRVAMAQVARALFGDPTGHLATVGITGTNGKTTCAHAVAAAVEGARGAGTAGVVGTLGARLGARRWPLALTTPEASDSLRLLAAMRAAGAQAAVLEASSQALAQDRLAGLAFDVGLFTQLGEDHHEWHGGREATFLAKCRLFSDHLKAGATVVAPAGDPFGARLPRPAGSARLLYGDGPHAQVRARRVRLTREGTAVEVDSPAGPLHLESALVGQVNVLNLLATCAVACALGLPAEAIVGGLAGLVPPRGRMQRLVGPPGRPAVFVDYAHTPDAVALALASLRGLTRGRLVCVVGCGGERDVGKRAPMGRAAAAGADQVIVTNDNPRGEDPEAIAHEVARGAQAAAPRIVIDRRRAIAEAIAGAEAADTVAILGRGHEAHQLIGADRLPLDDAAWATTCLADTSRGG